MNSTEQALKVLKLFLTEMNKWESYWYQVQYENLEVDYTEELKKEIDAIYEKYVTVRERKLGKQVALSTRFPSTFTPDGEIISCELSANNKKIVIEVHKKFDTGVVYEYRYTLIFKNKEWRVDRREMLDYDGRWIKDTL
ncbi:NTF2 fold immunity protein of polymorphic toxin system component [Frischella perrara]|uniref:Putative metal-dependent RNase n=1 Tax=Frischella perrara TaxID=1267021 RepID=A0A0A7RYP2_FRIPE|nr:NTF2 fold immunity protein [Frischella perrara]AJA44384.1 putative metal-dependent RNase [Frischella perrara]PWV64071.1 NTF2 fold immunity protein of polymorphic toxin system component [Frischella perrara]